MMIVSPVLAPTWKVIGVVDPRALMPLKVIVLTMRLHSADSWTISAVMAALSPVESVPLLYWTASSRTRCRIECTSFSAPSADCTSDTPSSELRLAWLRPRIWARIFSEMARPAASSAARLMRRPLESFSMLLESVVWVPSSWRWALNASTLVLMRSDMAILPDGRRAVLARGLRSHRSRHLILKLGRPSPACLHSPLRGLAALAVRGLPGLARGVSAGRRTALNEYDYP